MLALRDELAEAFDRFLASGRYVHGPEHEAFQQELAALVGVASCAGVASGTDALQLALLAAGCEPGDQILTAANAGGYSAAAARRVGLRVRYADVDAGTLSLSGETVGGWIRERRLEWARGALVSPSFARHSIGAVAFAAGFTDITHFSHAFRRRYGISPRRHRAEIGVAHL